MIRNAKGNLQTIQPVQSNEKRIEIMLHLLYQVLGICSKFLYQMAMDQNSHPRTHAQIPYLLKQAEHLMQRRTDTKLKKIGLNTAKYVVLRLLCEMPGLSSAQLARRSFLSPQSMQSMIVSLEKLGLVRRSGHPENARISQTFLTKQGETLELAAREIITIVSESMVRRISLEEQELFVGLLRRAIEGVGDIELIDGIPHRNGMIVGVSS